MIIKRTLKRKETAYVVDIHTIKNDGQWIRYNGYWKYKEAEVVAKSLIDNEIDLNKNINATSITKVKCTKDNDFKYKELTRFMKLDKNGKCCKMKITNS